MLVSWLEARGRMRLSTKQWKQANKQEEGADASLKCQKWEKLMAKDKHIRLKSPCPLISSVSVSKIAIFPTSVSESLCDIIHNIRTLLRKAQITLPCKECNIFIEDFHDLRRQKMMCVPTSLSWELTQTPVWMKSTFWSEISCT